MSKEDLVFQALDWQILDYEHSEYDDFFNENFENMEINSDNTEEDKKIKSYLIKIYGRDNNGNSISLNIPNYIPHFYLKGFDNFTTTYSKKVIEYLEQIINKKLFGSLKGGLLNIKIVKRKDMWGFNNDKIFKFALLTFKSWEAMKRSMKLFNFPITNKYLGLNKHNFSLYENTIEPFLRLIHKQDITPCGWILVEKGKYYRTDRFDIIKGYNYIVPKWRDIKPYLNENGEIPENFAQFRVMSFDIECNSFDGSFPSAIQHYEKLAYKIYELYKKNNNLLGDELEKKIISFIINQFKENKINLKKNINDDILENIKDKLITSDLISILKGNHESKICSISKKNRNINYYFNKFNNIDDINSYNEINIKKRTNSETINALETLLSDILPEQEGDPIIQIGLTTHKYGSLECYDKQVIVVGGCSNINGCNVINCETEQELIKKFVEIVKDIDPDIITGYNIFNFDFPYIYERAQELDCVHYLCNMGKTYEPILECEYEIKKVKEKYTNKRKCIQHWSSKSLSSSALGDNFLNYINMEGRIVLDLMKIIQREHKLNSYKLDDVSKHFMSGKIKSYIIEKDNAILILDNIVGLSSGDTIKIDNKKYEIASINEKNKEVKIYIKEDFTLNIMLWNISKDDVSPKMIFECQKGTDDDRAKVAHYCVQDCALCNYLIMKLEVIANNISMANVCYVPLSYIFLRGQGIKGFSLISKYCKDEGYLIPTLTNNWKCENDICGNNNTSFDDICKVCGGEKPEDDSFEGAIVLTPKPGIYTEPISVLDYASLYPSSIISENISHDTEVDINDEKLMKLIKKEGYELVNITYNIYKGKKDKKKLVGQETSTFIQPKKNKKGEIIGKRGLIPKILMKLLGQRKKTRNKITWKTILLNTEEKIIGNIIEKECNNKYIVINKKDKEIIKIERKDIISISDTYDDFQKAVLDGSQLGYKCSANSIYGLLGASTSKICKKSLANSTTATGRKLLIQAKDFAEKEYGCEVIYGDSDSIFIKFPRLEDKEYEKYGYHTLEQNIRQHNKVIGEQLSDDFRIKMLKHPHNLEWEKQFDPFILLEKKRYCGRKYDKSVDKFEEVSMGIVTKRRDNANIVKIAFGGCIHIILEDKDINKSIKFLKESLKKICNKEYPLEEFIISKTLRGFYKQPDAIGHKVLAERMKKRDPGSAPQVNDRIQYAYIQVDEKKFEKENPGVKMLQGDKMEDPKFIRLNNLKVNYLFYITNQIMNPILQLYALVLEDLPGFKHKDRKHFKKIYKKLLNNGNSEKQAKDKIKKMREIEVKELLFDNIINKMENKKKGMKNITEYFN
jgi:DNA polymerase elongation subunit (family B)